MPDRWLREERAGYVALKPNERAGRGSLVQYSGRPAQDVDRAWDTRLIKLEMPKRYGAPSFSWANTLFRHRRRLATTINEIAARLD